MATLFLTPLLRDRPEASLAAIAVVAEMERIAPLTRLWRLRRSDFVLAMVAVVGVLVFDILPGLAIAVAPSLGAVVWRASPVRVHVVGEVGPTTPTVDIARSAVAPGLRVVRPEQVMFFANAAEIRDALVEAAGRQATAPDVGAPDLVLTPDLDVPTMDAIGENVGRAADAGAHLRPAGLMSDVRIGLEGAGLADRIGREHLFDDVVGATVADVNLHSTGIGTRRQVLSEFMEIIDARRRDPTLDAHARAALDAVTERVIGELRQLAPGPDTRP